MFSVYSTLLRQATLPATGRFAKDSPRLPCRNGWDSHLFVEPAPAGVNPKANFKNHLNPPAESRQFYFLCWKMKLDRSTVHSERSSFLRFFYQSSRALADSKDPNTSKPFRPLQVWPPLWSRWCERAALSAWAQWAVQGPRRALKKEKRVVSLVLQVHSGWVGGGEVYHACALWCLA